MIETEIISNQHGSAGIGKVYLVGAGPGDPRLITQRGIECLKQADLVLYDGLVNPLVLRWTKGVCEKTGRIKRPHETTVHQHEINERLICEARLGKTVVRLKGGDPFIFGRGGEEAEALAQAAIPFEIIPGITAATAAAEYAGIALTHREHVSQLLFITGHEDPLKPERKIDDELLASFEGTIVVYMGLHRLPELIDRLIKAGKSPQMPVAVISKASTPAQRTVESTLEHLVDDVHQAQLEPPSLTIIGPCVPHRKLITWYECKPLFGLNIGVTRPVHQSDQQIESLLNLGAQPVLMPMIDIVAPDDWSEPDQAIGNINIYSWMVFTSRNGVESFLGRIWQRGADWRLFNNLKIACIGESTAAALQEFHLRADLVPNSYSSEHLAESLLAQSQPGDRILWPKANRGRDHLPNALREQGRFVDEVIVYHHVDQDHFPEHTLRLINDHHLHWVGLSSPAIARQYATVMNQLHTCGDLAHEASTHIKLAAISPITAQAAQECGLFISAVAQTYTWDGLIDAIYRAHSGKSSVGSGAFVGGADGIG